MATLSQTVMGEETGARFNPHPYVFSRRVLCVALSSHLVLTLVIHTENLIDRGFPVLNGLQGDCLLSMIGLNQ